MSGSSLHTGLEFSTGSRNIWKSQNIYRETTFGVQANGKIFKVYSFSFFSLILFSFLLTGSLIAWGCTLSAFSCPLCFSPVHFSSLSSHTPTNTSHAHYTHSPYTPHILSSLTLHMLFSGSLHTLYVLSLSLRMVTPRALHSLSHLFLAPVFYWYSKSR